MRRVKPLSSVATRPLAISLLLAMALVACQAKAPTGGKGRPTAAPQAKASPSLPSAATEVARNLAGSLQRVSLVGEVRLISDHGGGIVSNNGGTLLSNHGGGLVSDQGGSLVANNGGGLVSNNGGAYRLAQAERAASESFLAEALVEFLDAKGQRLVDAQGQPVGASTDRNGVFRFEGDLPAEALVARVRLYQGGELLAMVVPDAKASGPRQLSLGTATTLGAAFVLGEYVKGRPEVYAKLPPNQAEALALETEAARVRLGPGHRPSYQRADMLATTQSLRNQDPTLNGRLEQIKALLLAGQANLGEGLLATQVALSAPVAALPWKDGELAIVELLDTRIRLVNAQGRVRQLAVDAQGGPKPLLVVEAVPAQDGGLYLADRLGVRIYHLGLDGKLKIVAGNGLEGQVATTGLATAIPLITPGALTALPGGGFMFGEVSNAKGRQGRLFQVDPQGQIAPVPLPPDLATPDQGRCGFSALCAFPDGSVALYARTGGGDFPTTLTLRWRQADGTWEAPIYTTQNEPDDAALWAEADGSVLLSINGKQQVRRFTRTGQSSVVAGTGRAGLAGDGGLATEAQLNAPAGLHRLPDGRLLIADQGNGLIRVVGTDGRIGSLAGAASLTQTGDALAVAINGPGGLALDPQGNILVSESFSSTIKRLVGDRLELVAGSVNGNEGDGGPVALATFDNPFGLAQGPLGLVVADSGNFRLRLITPDGQIRALAGSRKRGENPERSVAPEAILMRRPIAVAQGPDGSVAWADNENHTVWRIKPGGQAERLAGTGQQGDSGDGGPGHEAKLSLPLAVAFGPDGMLYVADTGNMRVRRIRLDGVIESFAGVPFLQLVPRYQSGDMLDPDGTPRLEAALMGPGSLCFDAKGQLYVGEAGSIQLQSVIGSALAVSLPSGGQIVGSRVRRIALDGRVSTVAGQGGKVLAANEGDDALGIPAALLVDGQGRLIIADSTRNQLKLVPASALQ